MVLPAGLVLPPAWTLVVATDVCVEMDAAGRIGVGVVDVPDDDGRIVDKGRDAPVFGCNGAVPT